MGLDMYLFGSELADCETFKITMTEEIYWRKANHIHKWFVDNVQGGCDNCAYYPLTKYHLIELKKACELVLSDRSKASEILPTQEGFFFGTVEYDEYYFYECQRTVDEINRILKEDKYIEFDYASSW